MPTKIGRNDKCICGSSRKYKLCCLRRIENNKIEEAEKYNDGHEYSSEAIELIGSMILEDYKDHKFIDVSNYLNPEFYQNLQTKNYYKKVIMIAERNDISKEVFSKRVPNEEFNVMIMYKGAYKCFEGSNFAMAYDEIKNMIDTRLRGDEVK